MAREVKIAILGDSRDFSRAVDAVERDTGRMKGAFATIGGFAKTAGVGFGAIAAGTAVVGKQVLDAGGKLEAWRLKTDTVFEDNAASVRKWADKNNEAFGVSEDQLAGMAAGFGDLLKPMGFTADQAASMSKDVVGLSGALSEWSGGQRSASEVSDILAKAMLGEREGLKELGISISEADVQARLLEKGQGKLTGAALAQAKAVATQELIFEKSTDAQKAYAEGGNKALRASNKLKAGIEDLKNKAVDKLLPVAVKLAEWVGQNLPPLIDRGARVFREALLPAIQRIIAFVQEKWPQIQAVIQSVLDTVRAVIDGFVSVVTTLWENFGNNIIEFAQRVWGPIQQLIEGAMEFIRGVIQTVTSLIKGDWEGVWEGIKQIFSGAWSAIQGAIKTAFEGLRGIIGVALEVAGSVFKGFWDGIFNFLKEAPGKIASTAKGLFDGIKEAFRSAINWIIRAWNKLEFEIPGFDPPGPGPKFGGFTLGVPDIPTLHAGGIFKAPRGMTEGLALLRNGERVLSPAQSRSAGGNNYYITVNAVDGAGAARAVKDALRTAGARGVA